MSVGSITRRDAVTVTPAFTAPRNDALKLVASSTRGGNTQSDAARVKREIQQAFASGGYMSNAELRSIAASIRALSPAERKALVTQLSQDDTLARLLGETVLPGWFDRGGLTRPQRLALLSDLMQYQGGGVLSTLVGALGQLENNVQPRPGTWLETLVRNAVDEPVDVISYLRGPGLGTLAQRKSAADVLARHATRDPAQAAALARLIGSADPKTADGRALINHALGRLDRQGLAAVLHAVDPVQLVELSVPEYGVQRILVFEPGRLTALLNAVARGAASPSERAEMFVQASRSLKAMSAAGARSAELAPVLDAMTRLITHDAAGNMSTNAVLKIVFDQGAFDGQGRAISQGIAGHVAYRTYAQAMIDTGRAATLRVQLEQLRRGDALRESPQQRLGTELAPGSESIEQRQLAFRYGQMLGAISAAIRSINASKDDKTRLLLAFFGAANAFNKDFNNEVYKAFGKLQISAITAAVGVGLFATALEANRAAGQKTTAEIADLLERFTPKIERGNALYPTGSGGNPNIQDSVQTGRSRASTSL